MDEPVEVVVDEQERVIEGVERLLRGTLEQLPAIVTALVVLALFWVLGWAVRRVARRLLLWRTDRPSFADVVSRIARGAVIVIGGFLALVIAAPSVDLAALVTNLGVTSIAIGFAFKDILQNSLAGLLLLFREPFRTGDEIEVDDWRGAVEAISIRETRLRTFDNRRVLIANSDIYGKAVAVQTAYGARRTTLLIGVDYEADLARAQQVIVEAARATDGVLDRPAPEAHYTEFTTSTVDLALRVWTAPRQATVNVVLDRLVQQVKAAAEAADIKLPADVVEVDLRTDARRLLTSLTPGSPDDGGDGSGDGTWS